MKYIEIVHDDFVIIQLNREYFSLPLFIYEQVPSKVDIITYVDTTQKYVSRKTFETVSKTVSKIIKVKRTKTLK